MCRIIHVRLVGVNPGLHCPHVGPSGGGKCVDVPYVGGGILVMRSYGWWSWGRRLGVHGVRSWGG